jgi:peptide chain release factor 3
MPRPPRRRRSPPLRFPQVTVTTDPVARETARRRTFAIISHPDAGKTTLTEKLLLYGGAIHLAGTVKSRRADRHVTSDWMAMERERGISVTSSAMQFVWEDHVINLLDTPGHADFSEDTYRTLIAADAAVMLLDNRKGVEERTKQLFDVCKKRRLPIFTFVNKCDRWGEDPLTLVSDVEAHLGIGTHVVTWPIFRSEALNAGLVGVVHRHQRMVYLLERHAEAARRGEKAEAQALPLDSDATREALGAATYQKLLEELSLLDEAGAPFDRDAVRAGVQTPVYFGSALTDFGVEPFLHDFVRLSPPPGGRETTAGDTVLPGDAFSGFVFKIQANMDPKHRDRLAFIRIVSGHFTAGMDAQHVRTAKKLRLAGPQTFLAQDRSAVEEAFPGDVIGIVDRGVLHVGDTIAVGKGVDFGGLPRFAPEHFARVELVDAIKRKQLDAGIRQLTSEGAAQLFYTSPSAVSGPSAIVGVVGRLQFDVLLHRLEHEYGVTARLDAMGNRQIRWVQGTPEAIEAAARERGRTLLYDSTGAPLFMFEDPWTLRYALSNETRVTLHETAG